MGNLGRVAIACIAALLIGAYTYATAFDLHQTEILGDVVYSPVLPWVFVALLILPAALGNRWWASSVALVPLATLVFLHSATDYVYPYHEDSYPAITIVGTGFLLGISLLGFPLRALFIWAVSRAWLPKLRDKLG